MRDFQKVFRVLNDLNSGIDLLVCCGHQSLDYPLQVLLTSIDDRFLLSCSCRVDSQADAIDDDQVDSFFEALLSRHLVNVALHEVDDAKNVSDGERFALKGLELSGLRLAEGCQVVYHVKDGEGVTLRELSILTKLVDDQVEVNCFGNFLKNDRLLA